jgi:hypothetical protein
MALHSKNHQILKDQFPAHRPSFEKSVNSTGCLSLCNHKDRLQTVTEALIMSVAQATLLERRLKIEQDLNASIKARLKQCTQCLRILHAQRPYQTNDKIMDSTKLVSHLISGLERLASLENKYQEKEMLLNSEMEELHFLRTWHAQSMDTQKVVQAAVCCSCSKENLSRNIDSEHKTEEGYRKLAEQSQHTDVVCENARLKSEVQALQARLDFLANSAASQELALNQLSECLKDCQSKLTEEKAINHHVKACAREKRLSIDKLLALVTHLESQNTRIFKELETREEEISAMAAELRGCQSKGQEKERMLLLLEQQCAAFELALAVQSEEHKSFAAPDVPHADLPGKHGLASSQATCLPKTIKAEAASAKGNAGTSRKCNPTSSPGLASVIIPPQRLMQSARTSQVDVHKRRESSACKNSMHTEGKRAKSTNSAPIARRHTTLGSK